METITTKKVRDPRKTQEVDCVLKTSGLVYLCPSCEDPSPLVKSGWAKYNGESRQNYLCRSCGCRTIHPIFTIPRADLQTALTFMDGEPVLTGKEQTLLDMMKSIFRDRGIRVDE